MLGRSIVIDGGLPLSLERARLEPCSLRVGLLWVLSRRPGVAASFCPWCSGDGVGRGWGGVPTVPTGDFACTRVCELPLGVRLAGPGLHLLPCSGAAGGCRVLAAPPGGELSGCLRGDWARRPFGLTGPPHHRNWTAPPVVALRVPCTTAFWSTRSRGLARGGAMARGWDRARGALMVTAPVSLTALPPAPLTRRFPSGADGCRGLRARGARPPPVSALTGGAAGRMERVVGHRALTAPARSASLGAAQPRSETVISSTDTTEGYRAHRTSIPIGGDYTGR